MPRRTPSLAPQSVSTWKVPSHLLLEYGLHPPRTGAPLSKAEVLFCQLTDRVDAEFLAQAPRLKIVATLSAGTNHIDLKECARRKITVLNTPEVLTEATAELTLALLLAVARRLGEGERICRKNAFPGWSPDYLLGIGLRGRRALIVGQGRIGREVARKFRALGIRSTFVTRKDSATEIREKLKCADILSFHCPLTPQTHHWLTKERIALLPREAIVLNTARGPVLDERALAAALREKRIFGAALDVYTEEPEIPAFWRKLTNVFLCPHLGSATRETREAMMRLLLDGVRETLAGRRAKNVVPPPRKEKVS